MTFAASSYFHDILSPGRTQECLTEDQSFLARRSSLNPDKFILSYLVNNRIKHEIVENPNKTRKNVRFQDVAGVIEEMVSSNKNCVHAIFPPPPESRERAEILAKEMKLPFKVADIINSPIDSFKELLSRPGLSPEQINVCHDIRRCGKNKEADNESCHPEDCEDPGGDDGDVQESHSQGDKPAGKKASPADKEARDAAKTVKEDVKKKAKVAIKKAKLAAADNVQKDKTEVNRGRRIERQHQCFVCHETCETNKKLSDHLNSHRVRKCQHCSVYVHAKNLAFHKKGCLDTPKLKCGQCDFKTHNKCHLEEHAKVHREKLPCSTCGKQFATKERLAAHMACHKKGLKCSKPRTVISLYKEFQGKKLFEFLLLLLV